MAEYLTFQLYGPLMSWGEVAVGEERPSRPWPTRSGVLGLLAAALGIRRGDEAGLSGLNQSLGLAVRVDAPGCRLRDYHTVQVAKEPKKGSWYACRADELRAPEEWISTILSRREYLQDALFTACVWLRGESAHSLADLAGALRAPRLTPYLGRKACPPGLPFDPRIVEHSDPLAALAAYAVAPALERLPGVGATALVLMDEKDAVACGAHGEQTITVRDLPVHFGRRQYDTRPVRLVQAAPADSREG